MKDFNGIKLAVFDVDGTLLDKQGTLTDEVADYLMCLKNKGVILGLATGRSLERVLKFTDRIDDGMKLILMNGAWVHDLTTGEDLRALNLRRETALKAVQLLREWDYEIIVQKGIPDCHIFYYDTLDESNLERRSRIERNIARCARVNDLIDILEGDPGEITVLDTDERIIRCREMLRAAELDCRLIYSTSPFTPGYSWLEILPREATKGNALKFLAGCLGIDRGNVLAVGDNYNDIEMIDWAGIGVAVGSAEPGVRKYADVVLPDNGQGILNMRLFWSR